MLPENSSPFIIEHYQTDITPNHFKPAARLIVTPALRTSGLLQALPEESVRTLLTMLTFLTDNGHIHPTAPELANALNISVMQMGFKMRRVTALKWQGMPLVQVHHRDSGADAYVLSSKVITETEKPAEDATIVNLPIPSHREAVIEHSRTNYARPRAEVEKIIAEQLGHSIEETLDTPEGEARRRLIRLGVPREEGQRLVTNYPLESIMAQIEWLPHRGAKSPARYLIAAIEGDYEPPAKVRLERMVQQDSQQEQAEAGGQE